MEISPTHPHQARICRITIISNQEARIAVEFGIHLGDEPLSVDPREHLNTLLAIVEAGQEAGFTLFTLGQHFGYTGIRWLQPIPTLARLAAETGPHVRLGTSILIGPVYPPVILAEELATLDVITGGRLVVGIGSGYLPSEYAMVGLPFEERYARLEELLTVLPALWHNDVTNFEGPFTKLSGVSRHLRPLQEPGPPIWVGAMGPAGVKRAARLADAWTITPQQTVDEVRALIGEYAAERVRAGKPLGRLPLRREIQVADSFEAALDTFAAVAQYKYESYLDRGMDMLSATQVRDAFADTVSSHVILGDPQSCREQIVTIAQALPVNPIIFRPHWPGMSRTSALQEVTRLGREIVQPLAGLESIDMHDPPSFENLVDERS